MRRTRSLFGIAPGGACLASPVARPAVGSYPTVSPLPACNIGYPIRTQAVYFLWRFPWGYPRRALPGTIALWSPDFPRDCYQPRDHPAFRAIAFCVLFERSSMGWSVKPLSRLTQIENYVMCRTSNAGSHSRSMPTSAVLKTVKCKTINEGRRTSRHEPKLEETIRSITCDILLDSNHRHNRHHQDPKLGGLW